MPVRTRRNRDRSAFLPHLRDRLPWRPPSKSGRSIGGGAAAEHSNTVRGPSQEMGRPARYVGWAVVGHSALRRAGRLQTRSNSPSAFSKSCAKIGATKMGRSEERREGKEGVSTWRSRWAQSHYKQKKTTRA